MTTSIKYTAALDDSGFAAGMARVRASMMAGRDQFTGLGRESGTATAAMKAHMADAAKSMRDSIAGMGGHFSGLLTSLGGTRIGMMALVGAGAALGAAKVVNVAADMTEATMDLARAMGITTNQATAWKIALDDVGASQDEFAAAGKGLSRQLKENEDQMQAMGLKTRDAAGNFRPMNDLMLDAITLVNGYADGTEKAIASQTVFGRSVDASSKLLLLNESTLQQSIRLMRELGLEVGANAVQSWGEFDDATDKAKKGVQGLAFTAGTVLMPVLTDMTNLFNAVMPAAVDGVRSVLGGLAQSFYTTQKEVRALWETINAMVITVAEPLRAMGEGLYRAVQGDFSGAASVIKGIGSNISTAWSTAMANIAETSRITSERIKAIWQPDTAAGLTPKTDGNTTSAAGKDGKARAARAPRARAADFVGPELAGTEYYDRMLAEAKRAAAEQDALREYSKGQELAYWQGVLQSATLTGTDRVQITRKVADLEVQVWREAAKQRQALDAEVLKGQQDRALGALDAARQEVRAQFELGEVSRAQLIEQERQLEEQRTEIKRQYLATRQALIDPDRDPVAYEQISQQIEEQERQHRARMRELQVQAAQEARATNPMASMWDQARAAMDNALQGMIRGQQTLRQALQSSWAGIRGAVLGELLKIGQAKIAAFAKDRLMAMAGIGVKAAEAGAGAAASQASIPIIGPGLALAAMASVFAAVGGMSGKVPSAARGYDIPFGVNPLTQLHQREMVLPAAQADVIRDMADGGGAAASPINLTIHAVDGASVQRLFEQNSGALVATLKQAVRDFHNL
jgi:hypothetical protein